MKIWMIRWKYEDSNQTYVGDYAFDTEAAANMYLSMHPDVIGTAFETYLFSEENAMHAKTVKETLNKGRAT